MAAHIYLCLLSVIIFTTSGFPLNLTLTDYNNPQANHFLDAKIVEDILIASAMVQGIEFYGDDKKIYEKKPLQYLEDHEILAKTIPEQLRTEYEFDIPKDKWKSLAELSITTGENPASCNSTTVCEPM